MGSLKWAALLIGVVLVITLLSVPQVRFLFFGMPERRLDGRSIALDADDAPSTPVPPRSRVERALTDAGLSAEPLLGDIATSGHLTRLDAGEVTVDQLLNYAEHLNALAFRTKGAGRQIPSTFWDVETDQMRVDGWTPYRVVAALASTEGRPYIDALGVAYTRFHAFKVSEPGADDTALDTALDLFEPAIRLIDEVPREHMLETSEHIRSKEQAALYLWQQLVVGSSRRNPLTHIKLFNHGFAQRFHVGTIWQYDTGMAQDNSAIWGVSGFAPRYVGPPENNNQVEHMSISMTVQGILREPLQILQAFEEFERLSGPVNSEETAADEALNLAVRQTFVPNLENDLQAAVSALRETLRAP
ncbi:hypothetical protein CLV78_11559 [Aliiruegeria haliotis]|uniref:Uncharacterized protein n=1 Tax=Aliiruegeria haliotis TaxID=1280846 RepID=A0A2T0RG77_9RHOB|nr:hypothetical protein [Aliiruegeria haliotis]PRY20110.1 hypothetical protein CLV78_11559 [Aliiruegeria haliotis]